MRSVLDFLHQLKQNNNRDWFLAHKAEYEHARLIVQQEVQTILNALVHFDAELYGLEAKDCIYRIYRDVRFSHDKTPYKTYFGAYLAKGGRKSPRAGYYFHLEEDKSLLVGGLWSPEPEPLKIVRQSIYENEEELIEIMEQPDLKSSFGDFDLDDTLKRMPATYIHAHMQRPDWLKLKSFVVSKQVDNAFFEQERWKDQAIHILSMTCPLNRFLNYALDEASSNTK